MGEQSDKSLRHLVPSPGSEAKWREIERYALLALLGEQGEAQKGMLSESAGKGQHMSEDPGLDSPMPQTPPLLTNHSTSEEYPLEPQGRRGGLSHQGLDLVVLSRMAIGFASAGRRDAAVFGAIEQAAAARITTSPPHSLGEFDGEDRPSTASFSLMGISRGTLPPPSGDTLEALSDLAHAFAQVN